MASAVKINKKSRIIIIFIKFLTIILLFKNKLITQNVSLSSIYTNIKQSTISIVMGLTL